MTVLVNHSLLFIVESTKGKCKNQGANREGEKEERRQSHFKEA